MISARIEKKDKQIDYNNLEKNGAAERVLFVCLVWLDCVWNFKLHRETKGHSANGVGMRECCEIDTQGRWQRAGSIEFQFAY